ALFGVALLLIWSTDRLLKFLVPAWRTNPPPLDKPAPDATDAAAVVSAVGRSWLCSRVVAGAFGVLLAAHLFLYGLPHSAAGVSEDYAELPAKLTDDTLPKDLDGWTLDKATSEQRNPGSAYGEFSRTWNYRTATGTAVFSLDYPFTGYHELTECYR